MQCREIPEAASCEHTSQRLLSALCSGRIDVPAILGFRLPSFSRAALGRIKGLVSTLAGLVLVLPIVFWTTTGAAQAHGGGTPQLVNAPAGPYQVSVWTQPDSIRAGQKLHISIAVSESSNQAEASNLVLGATVHVQLVNLTPTGETLAAFATHENAVNKLFYETDLDVPTEGEWQVLVEVEGPAGAGSAAFHIEALPSSASNTLVRRWPLWGGAGLALLATGWSVYAFRARRNLPSPITITALHADRAPAADIHGEP
jgi:hypothetical protein